MRFINIFLSSPFTPVLLALIIASCTLPMYIPDSYEQALGYICRFQEHPSCAQVDLQFRPPSMSLFLMPLTIGMSPFLAVGVLSMLCSAWCLLPIALIIRKKTKSNTLMWFGALGILLSPTLHLLNSLADARIFILPLLFSSWALTFIENPKKYQLFLCGGLMGIAGTTRPELLLGIVLLSGFSLFYHRKKSMWTILGAWTPYLIWISSLSVQAQKLVLGPRHWEGALLAIWEFVPKRIALRLYGMGMYSPPARSIPSDIPTTQTTDITVGFQWLFQILSMTPVVFIVGSLMIFLSWRKNKRVVSASIAIFLPYLIASFLPQARAPLFPQANMIPMLIVLYCYTGIALGKILLSCKKVPKLARFALIFAIIGTHALTVHLPEHPSGIEYTSSGTQAQKYIRKQPTGSYTSSYENASLIWLTENQWHQQNSPWDNIRSKYVLQSSIDMDILHDVKPIAFWAHEDSWVLIGHSDLDNRD